MALLTGRHDGVRILFDVAVVGVSRALSPFFENPEQAISVFSEPVLALVDTGATTSSVTPRAARKLALRPSGKRDVLTANGPIRVRCYDFQIAVIGRADKSDSPFFVLPDIVQGGELNSDAFSFDILLGMDVIRQGDLCVRRDGSFTFEF
jgi:hypothetical protein